MEEQFGLDGLDLRDDVEVFSDIIATAMEEHGDPDIAAVMVLSSERFKTLINTAYGDGVKDGLDTIG